MNVVTANQNKEIIDRLDIDIIKRIDGEYELRDLLRRFAEDIKLNQNYIRMIQEELKKEAKRYDIDENNFSIDNSAKKRMLKL